MRHLLGLFILMLPACGEVPSTPPDTATLPKRPEVKIEDLKVGTGAEVRPGFDVRVHYTGWLTSGTKFDSSRDRREPFQFKLGKREVIPGWEIGLLGMKVGGKRRLTIPPELGYGPEGQGEIPGNATLIFEIELLDVFGFD